MESRFKHQEGSGKSKNEQRLSTEETEDNALDGRGDHQFGDTHPAIGLLSHQTTKCDSRREGSKVDEDDSSQALWVKSISDVAEILWVTSFDVTHKTPKWLAGSLQRIFGWFCFCFFPLCAHPAPP